MTASAEALHDAIVLTHRRATATAGERVHALASDLATLAEAAVLLSRERPEKP